MFSKILIANRGEIAVRILRACREMGIETVAVFSECDKDALHVQLADEAVCIGPAKAEYSYLNMHNVIGAAIKTKAEAIHPGFGFLAENSMFASLCEEVGIKFIGPAAKTIDLLGNKANARELMILAGVPVIPGSDGLVETVADAKKLSKKLGYPVMVKATAGGGGRGIRLVRTEGELEAAYNSAKTEAKAAFNDGGIYIEKVIENARHIEVQILADATGNIMALGERDCSVQRRNQKLLEESPSPAINDKTRQQMSHAAVSAARAADYVNAGTIEFLYDKKGKFYFMEMNTRIQVEHPVTEMVTGIDIIKEQLRIAAGEPLSFDSVKLSGCALECRINAEKVSAGFAPSPGKIDYLFLPAGGPGLRVDSAIYAGYTVEPFYDSMLAKVITHGATRAEAIAKMKRALGEFVIKGIDTNIDFQLDLISEEAFVSGDFDTGFVNKLLGIQ